MEYKLLKAYYWAIGVILAGLLGMSQEEGFTILMKVFLVPMALLGWPLIALVAIFGNSDPQGKVAGILALVGFPVAFVIGAAIEARTKAKQEAKASALAEEQSRRARDNEARRRDEEQQRQSMRRRAECVSLVHQSERVSGSLANHVRGASHALLVAEEEFAEGLLSPFWDAMESAVRHLTSFNAALEQLAAARQEHRRLLASLPGLNLPFPGIPSVPGVRGATEKLNALYRTAQKDPHFAQIYEQRRQTAILQDGFRSMQEAIDSLGGKLTAQMSLLGMDIRDGIGGIKDSVETVGSRVGDFAEQSAEADRVAALQDEAQLANQERAAGELERIRKKLEG